MNEARKFWKIAPGEDAEAWPMFLNSGCIAIGYMGNDADYRDYQDKKTLKEVREKTRADGKDASKDVFMIWSFGHEMSPGDVVVANRGKGGVVGIGIVTSDYIPPNDPENPSKHEILRHSRKVNWIIKKPITSPPLQWPRDTLTTISPKRWGEIKKACIKDHPELKPMFDELESSTGLDVGENPKLTTVPKEVPEEVKQLMGIMAKEEPITRNVILYGPPGTGKTYLARLFAKMFANDARTKFVTFHQSFAYEEFVEGLKPKLDIGADTQVRYEVTDGVFKQICQYAERDPENRYLLIIDEINRANIAKVRRAHHTNRGRQTTTTGE